MNGKLNSALIELIFDEDCNDDYDDNYDDNDNINHDNDDQNVNEKCAGRDDFR